MEQIAIRVGESQEKVFVSAHKSMLEAMDKSFNSMNKTIKSLQQESTTLRREVANTLKDIPEIWGGILKISDSVRYMKESTDTKMLRISNLEEKSQELLKDIKKQMVRHQAENKVAASENNKVTKQQVDTLNLYFQDLVNNTVKCTQEGNRDRAGTDTLSTIKDQGENLRLHVQEMKDTDIKNIQTHVTHHIESMIDSVKQFQGTESEKAVQSTLT